MHHKFKETLEKVFVTPMESPLHWHELDHLLHAVGAKVTSTHAHAHKIVFPHGEYTLHMHHSGVIESERDLRAIRSLLGQAGVTPGHFPAKVK